jgi:hypothetical protein
MATSSNPDDRQIQSNTSGAPYYSSVSSHSRSRSTGYVAYRGVSQYSPYHPDDQRIFIGYAHGLNPDASDYALNDGILIGYAVQSADLEFRLMGEYSDVSFNTENAEGLQSPNILAVHLDLAKVVPMDAIDFTIGGRMSFSRLYFDYENPIYIDGQEFRGDALFGFGVGIPSGILWQAEGMSVQLLVTPTWTLYSDITDIGFDNDVIANDFNIPVSLSVGFEF